VSASAACCAWCGAEVVQQARGRRRRYCEGHRQAAHQSRKREADRRRKQAARVYEMTAQLDAATRARIRAEIDRRARLRIAAARGIAA
jgi:hypothetical protein